MSTILVTGASGNIGKVLAASLAKQHQVICMSRKNPGLELPWIGGEFQSFEDLRKLDSHKIDTVVHLGSVTGGCLERDGIMVNVEGTRCLMRYLIDRGCRKFVMASSVATIGLQSSKFRPQTVPIPDEHPCLDRDGYGLSKFLMEEITKYYQRQNEQLDVINIRLAAIFPDASPWEPAGIRPVGDWGVAAVSCMPLSDAVRVFTLAAEAAYKSGVRIFTAVPPKVWATVPTAELLRNWWGDEVDLSHFQKPGCEFDSIFDVSRIQQEIGFVAENAMRLLESKQ